MFKFRFWMRKLSMKGSGETVLELHSSAMERENCEVRFLYGQFAAQRMNFKHALSKFYDNVRMKHLFL
ncbi:hypothetical protein DXT99_22925 [Pontibacter diazotrophicus]|uniref:Uncharacterized protein n=1 Tax=Pontibacter diazotrophicus TaxID=1400979 RepID=A0A3D8L3Z7_9BACT|nr:hypothetical protein DXT99_22925 [Pontibacter diazotrophicus]